MTFKKAVGKIHLWLGLTSGLIVFIVAITGCIYVFQKEISEAVFHDTFFVTPSRTTTLPLSTLKEKAQAKLGRDMPLDFITTYREPGRAWEFTAYEEGSKDAVTYFDAVAYYKTAFINPYTGAVTGVIDYKYNFFSIIKYIHWSLLLSTPYGQPVVGVATLIFFVMLITGVILWWPKKWSKANAKKSFKIKWDASFKRLNYDLHNVFGFYALLIIAIISLTGLVWAFSWFQKTVYVVASLSVTPPADSTVKSIVRLMPASGNTPFDKAFISAQKIFSAAERIGVSVPSGKEDVISITGYKGKETYYNYDELRFDQYSGEFLYKRNFSQKNAGEKVISMNYDIHVGAALGLFGKILALLASLIAASLPVTGTMIWIGRNNKKKYKPFKKAG